MSKLHSKAVARGYVWNVDRLKAMYRVDTDAALAEKLDVNKSQVSRWRTGQTMPNDALRWVIFCDTGMLNEFIDELPKQHRLPGM